MEINESWKLIFCINHYCNNFPSAEVEYHSVINCSPGWKETQTAEIPKTQEARDTGATRHEMDEYVENETLEVGETRGAREHLEYNASEARKHVGY